MPSEERRKFCPLQYMAMRTCVVDSSGSNSLVVVLRPDDVVENLLFVLAEVGRRYVVGTVEKIRKSVKTKTSESSCNSGMLKNNSILQQEASSMRDHSPK